MTREPTEQIERQIEALEAEERELSRRLEGLRGRVSGLRQALDIVRANMAAGEAESVSPGARERPAQVRHRPLPDPATNARWACMLRLINDAPPEGVGVDELVRDTGKEGHSLPSSVARSLLSIAAREGVIRRVGTGRYRGSVSNDVGMQQNEPPSTSAEGGIGHSLGDAGSPGDAPSQGAPDGSTPSSSTTQPLSRTAMR